MRSRKEIWLDCLEAGKGRDTMERLTMLMPVLEVLLDIRGLLIDFQRKMEEKEQD
jgi:hypothetical protein